MTEREEGDFADGSRAQAWSSLRDSLDIPHASLRELRQIHGADVRVAESLLPGSRVEADGLLTAQGCAPSLLMSFKT